MMDTDSPTQNEEIIFEDYEKNEDEMFNNNEEKEEDIENEKDLSIGIFKEAPKFLQDNEYINEGYLLNCNTFKKSLKSLFMCHNETINVWSHLLAAIIFFFFDLFYFYFYN